MGRGGWGWGVRRGSPSGEFRPTMPRIPEQKTHHPLCENNILCVMHCLLVSINPEGGGCFKPEPKQGPCLGIVFKGECARCGYQHGKLHDSIKTEHKHNAADIELQLLKYVCSSAFTQNC